MSIQQIGQYIGQVISSPRTVPGIKGKAPGGRKAFRYFAGLQTPVGPRMQLVDMSLLSLRIGLP